VYDKLTNPLKKKKILKCVRWFPGKNNFFVLLAPLHYFCSLVYQIRKNIHSFSHSHWGKADDRNCNYGHPKMADVESGKNLFCQLNCFYNHWGKTDDRNCNYGHPKMTDVESGKNVFCRNI
jgi:hypothetical protein